MPIANLNAHDMYHELDGAGEAVVVVPGWGSYCHGGNQRVPAGLADRYQVVLYDHRGVGESTDPADVPATSQLHAADLVALLNHLGIERAHLLGMGGMGGCIVQWVAITNPDRVQSLVLSGAWAKADSYFWHQLETMRLLHRNAGFWAYQAYATTVCSTPAYFNEHQDRLLGPTGGWKYMNGKIAVHEKFITVCQDHDALSELDRIEAPTLINWCGVEDQLTGERLSRPLVDKIKDHETLVLEGAPHSIHQIPEAQATLSQGILDFLGRQSR